MAFKNWCSSSHCQQFQPEFGFDSSSTSMLSSTSSRTNSSSEKNNSEASTDVEGSLQIQLKKKLENLTTSISKQKDRLRLIYGIMQSFQHKLSESENMQIQQNYQNQIYEQLKNNIEEQEKQCRKLNVILDGKIKVSETKRISTELREKSKLLKNAAGTNDRAGLKSSKNTTRQSPYQQSNASSTSSRYNQRFSQTYSRNNSNSQSFMTYRDNPPISKQSSKSTEVNRDRGVNTTFTTGKQERNLLSLNVNENPQEQSLKRQLQQLQHQQEVLNAQGMALAAQGNIPSSQVELLRHLLGQQQGKNAEDHELYDSIGNKSLPINYPTSYNRTSPDDATDRQQSGSTFSMLNTILQQISAQTGMNMQLSTDGNSSSGDHDNPLSPEILIQLQRLQTQLQDQMKTLGNQYQNDDQQRHQNISVVVSALQQLQQMQLDLLQRKITTGNASQSQKINTRPETRSDIFSVCDSPSDYMQPSPVETTLQFQGGYAPSDANSSYINTGIQPSNIQRSCSIEQGQPSQFRVPASPSASYFPSPYNIARSPSQRSPRPMSADYQMSGSYARTDQGITSNSPVLSNDAYGRCSSSDGMESLMSMSPGSHISQSNSNDGMRNVRDDIHDNNHDAKMSAEKKEKKLEDSLYDYVQTLPGQTQQLMQLHQAQRVHIIRMQHQQLQALMQQQNQQHQEQQQQHQQQESFVNMQNDIEHRVQNDYNLTSAHAHQNTQSHGNIERTASASCSSQSSDIQANRSPDNWQNDLQADQVVAMNDFDLLELLNGQQGFGFDEEDEKVLDLLISEGGDTFFV